MKKTLLSFSAVLLVSIAHALPNVFNFEMPKIGSLLKDVKSSKNRFTDNVSQLLMQYHMSQSKGFKQDMIDQLMKTSGMRSQVNGFQWKDCGSAAGKISSLNISPDPIQFPGTITVSVGFTLNTTLDKPLAMSVIWEKKNNQGQFVEIPCIEDLFTCNYTDVCELMDQIVQCPDPLVAAGIPCQCPITKGQYLMNNANFEIDAAVFSQGDYRIKVMVMAKGKQVFCIDMTASVSSG
ncbi:ganglioside GM2 activator [Mytilus galloprovincialis]|uniref:Ganglioside GM2 activator n=1 Tax=Mytilus galloprovincialis TaxID=29158 RepID=A0A8B6ECJ2_MYTGA|nr:ganglioside GM2 activator [Mytilus galloprovincialis]